MDNFEYCGACLATDVKMYDLSGKYTNNSSSTLGHVCARLLQIPKFVKHHQICFECARLISRFQEFRSKCQKAQILLSNLRLLADPDTLKEVIQNVDREFYKLASNLTFSHVITTNSTTDGFSDSKTVDARPNVNTKSLKEITETEITSFNKANCNIECDEDKHVNRGVINTLDDCEGEGDDNDNECDDNNDIDDDKSDCNEGADQNDDEMVHDKNEVNEIVDDDENDDIPTEYINYSEDSSVSDNTLLGSEKLEPKATEKIITRKRTMEPNINEDISDLDDEPSSKECNPINVRNVGTKCSKSNFSLFKDFTIVNLTPEEARIDLLLRKESTSYKTFRFKCGFCYIGYSVRSTYENHMRRHHPEYGKYECDLCHIRFPDKNLLCKHYMDWHKRKYCCKVCPYTTYAIEQAKTHITLHKNKMYPCQECGEVFRLPNSLLLHRRKKHASKCVCELCGGTFDSPHTLDLHKKRKHRQAQVKTQLKNCPICNKCFRNLTDRRLHIQNYHKNVSWPTKIKTKRKYIEEE